MTALQELLRRGINYVCGNCGAILYHSGPDGAVEGGETGFASRQPWEVVEKMISCPQCGRKLNPDPDPNTIKLQKIEEPQRSLELA